MKVSTPLRRSWLLKTLTVVACLAVASAGASLQTTDRQPARIASVAVVNTAAIVPTNVTVGLADPMLGFLSDADLNRQLDLMVSIGVTSLRIDVPWVAVQPTRFGGYDWSKADRVINAAAARGIGVLGILGQPPAWAAAPGTPELSGRPASATAFAQYARAVATRYRGKISAYEIWNEPNMLSFYKPYPDPVGYTALLRAAYPAIKAADRNAIVVGGVLAAAVDTSYSVDPVTFVQRMYAAGAKPYFDALSYHPYQHGLKFSEGGPWVDAPLNQGLRIRQLMIDYGDAGKKIWASEYGVPTALQDEATQAAFIADLISTWRTVDFTGPVFVYTMRDKLTGSTDPEDTFGIFRSDWTAKLAVDVIRQAVGGSPAAIAMVTRAVLGDVGAGAVAEPVPSVPTLVREALTAAVSAIVRVVADVVTRVVATVARFVPPPAVPAPAPAAERVVAASDTRRAVEPEAVAPVQAPREASNDDPEPEAPRKSRDKTSTWGSHTTQELETPAEPAADTTTPDAESPRSTDDDPAPDAPDTAASESEPSDAEASDSDDSGSDSGDGAA
ncbi:MAG: hypothetical protein JHC55_17715 [Mycolicibacterium sp.]|nr:hypothetical protein [Mycolicibacterium sp.]